MVYQLEEQKLIQAVDMFAEQMKRRLLNKFRQGYTGWDDPEKIPDFELIVRMSDDINSENPHLKAVDIANRAMMLAYRKR